MIAFRLGWFSPHRAGGWRAWAASVDVGRHKAAWTVWISVCVLGLTLEAETGWGLKGGESYD